MRWRIDPTVLSKVLDLIAVRTIDHAWITVERIGARLRD